jgi:hypothetical protein
VKRGQVILEYVLALCALLAVAGALAVLADAARASARRTVSLVRTDYP